MEIKKTIKRGLQFLILLIVLDLLVGFVFGSLFMNQKSGVYHKTNEGFYESDADVFIFGSSNANHHIVPSVISEKTGLSAYNMGRDGMDIMYHYSMFQAVIKRHKPKYVILCLTPIEFSNIDSYDRLSKLAPYTKSDKDIRQMVYKRSIYEPLKLLSNSYIYNTMPTSLIFGLKKKTNQNEDNGYTPLFSEEFLGGDNPLTYKVDSILDSNRVNSYIGFMKLAKKHEIPVYTVMSPWYFVENPETNTITTIEKITDKYNSLLINYTDNPNYTGNKEKFFDEGHLRHESAIEFTSDVVEEICEKQ